MSGTIKDVDPNGLIRLTAMCTEKTTYHFGRIPDSVLNLTVVEPGPIQVVSMFIKKGTFDMKSEHITFKNIPHPAFLFMFKVSEMKIVDTKIAAFKGIDNKNQVKDSTKLYVYPFSHVNTSFGVCWGNVALPEIDSLEVLEVVPHAFWLNSTHSLYHTVNAAGNVKLNNEEFFKKLESGELDIENCLAEANMTYGKFVEKFM